MRIVVINASTDLYGANRILSLAIKAFPKSSSVQMLLPDLDGPLIPYLQHNNPNVDLRLCEVIPVIQRKMFSLQGGVGVLNLIRKFYGILKAENKKEKIDLLYVNTLSNFFVLPAARYLKINTLTHVHEILESPKSISNFINKFGVKWSTSVLAVSHAVKQNLLKSSGSQGNKKISVIHNGIPDLYDPTPNVDSLTPKCIITLIARIKPEKGIWYFLESLTLLKEKKNIQVRIIGSAAPHGESYVEKLKKDILGMDMDIDYIPFIPETKKYLNETDILVVPSIMKDPFPTTVLEGLSVGKLVIATDTGGAAEAIQHEKSGYLIPSDNPQNFADTLAHFIYNSKVREEIGKCARERYLALFTLEIFNDKLKKYITGKIN